MQNYRLKLHVCRALLSQTTVCEYRHTNLFTYLLTYLILIVIYVDLAIVFVADEVRELNSAAQAADPDISDDLGPVTTGASNDEVPANNTVGVIKSFEMYTVFREKHPLRFLLYLRGKCLDFHEIFTKCSKSIKYSSGRKVRYFCYQ